MFVARVLMVGWAVLLLASIPVIAVTPDSTSAPRLSDEDLLDAILLTASVEIPDGFDRQREVVSREIANILDQVDEGPPTYRRAKRLHRLLHDHYLREYVADADTLQELIVTGRYNCLSATLLYGVVARRLGYEVEVLKIPGHLLLRLAIDGRTFDVEMTSPRGFNLTHYAGLRPVETPDSGMSLRLEWPRTSPRYQQTVAPQWMVSLEAAVGFAWINKGWRALEAGEPALAAECVVRARSYLRGLTTQEEAVSRLLVRAFRDEYESGRFDSAYAIAAVDVGLFPEMTTSRDRILAAALKRIEAACAEGRPADAAQILDEVARVNPSPVDLSRLERRSGPLIAAAAVHGEDWALARVAAERYALAEPDAVEGTRLIQWVDARSRGTAFVGDDRCDDRPPIVVLGSTD